VKLAVSYCFIGVIGGEFIMATAGLGHQIAYSFDNFQGERMYGLILLVLAITITMNMLVYAYERLLSRRRNA
jgi:NitT/TauT family transport system permease protein